MSGLVFGQVDAKVSNPWAYDATNDLPKTHPLYLASAGLVSTFTINDTSVAAGALVTTSQAAISVPAGKKGYVLDFWCSATGLFTVELDINTTGVVSLHTQTQGGGSLTSALQLNVPIVVAAGNTVGPIWKNNDSATKNVSIYLAVAIL